MATATVTSKGQVTIPAEIRRQLGIRPGTKIDFIWDGERTVEIHVRSRSIMELEGILPPLGRILTVEEMNEAIGRAAVEGAMP